MSKFPTKADLLKWIESNPNKTSKRDIAQAFGIKGAARADLKRVLKKLIADGHLEKSGKDHRDPDSLPPVSVLLITELDQDGDLFAQPMVWTSKLAAPRILIIPEGGKTATALGVGDRILARLQQIDGSDRAYEARIMRKIGAGPERVLGVYRAAQQGGRIVPIDKKSDREWLVPVGQSMDANDGDLVDAEQTGPKAKLGLPVARVITVLGDPNAPKAVSLYAIHTHGIPDRFPEQLDVELDDLPRFAAGQRQDLADLPFVTIDPVDARDHDDAIFAQTDDDPENPGGFVVWVAIADVAFYVRPATGLDREARVRGNSTYFPDRVVPMLPDQLSADLCSLHEGELRPSIVLRMVLDKTGQKISHTFLRATICSVASLNYAQVQAANDGQTDPKTAPLMQSVITPLFAAYGAVRAARDRRQPLNLDLPERKIILSPEGQVTSVSFSERLDAHRLVEEFMILANVSAAETLELRRAPLLYRVHEEPSREKLDGLRDVAQASGLTLAKGQVLKTSHLNHLLDASAGRDSAEIINLSVLRAMTQAYYGPQNAGHFGLALRRYAHFTSPIRRYADLLVHRALITAHGWGDDGLSEFDTDNLEETGAAISKTERRSMVAERDTNDRYLAAFLSARVGGEFEGKISGVARFGLFVRLTETGADGLVPISTLGAEYFRHIEAKQSLVGEKTGVEIKLGQAVTVRLDEAEAMTGGLKFEILTLDGKPLPSGGRGKSYRARKQGAPPRRNKSAKKPRNRSHKTTQ